MESPPTIQDEEDGPAWKNGKTLVGVIIVLGVACAYLLLDSFSTIVCDKISIMYFIQTFYQNVSTLLYNTYIT